jgi:Carboxypeptidase regulatory-like domain
MRLASYRYFLLPLILAFACVAAMAQQNSEIVGTVADQTGAAVPGAKLVLTQTETGLSYNGVSNSSGGYVFGGLNIGTYTLKISAKGFKSYSVSGLVLNVSQTLGQDVKLTIGDTSSEITITADALQVQVDSNTVGTLISGEQVTELATENRNLAALAALGLGASSNLPDNNTPTSVGASFAISINGLRQQHNIWLIDGGEADDRGSGGGAALMPSQNSIAQFEVLSSNYPPDYGISSGATISIGLKSGGQKYHGQAWEFVRNDVFDANNYFSKYGRTTPAPIPELRQNIFGGNVGGPVPLLKRNGQARTFFFFNMEWRRIIQGSNPSSTPAIPDADAAKTLQAGGAYAVPAFAPPTFPGLVAPCLPNNVAYTEREIADGLTPCGAMSVIPADLIDNNAVAWLTAGGINGTGLFPLANSTGDNYTGSAKQPITVWEPVARIDHQINDKWQVLAHYIHDAVSQDAAQPMIGWSGGSYPTITSTFANPSNSAAVKLTGTLSPSLLLEASFNYDGNIINIINHGDQTPTGFSVAKYFDNGAKDVPGVQLNSFYTGVQEQPGSAPWHNAAEDYSPRVDLSYTQGKHAMKFGFSYNRYTKNQQLFGNPSGYYQFGNGGIGAPGSTNDPYVDFLLGLSNNYQEANSLPTNHYVNQTTSIYANDNWKATPRLSLQIGFRYDALPHAWERANQVGNFDPYTFVQPNISVLFNSDGSLNPNAPGFATVNGVPFYLNGIDLAGQNGIPKGIVNTDYNTFQPRVGFSYDVTGTGKTVLRGGFGTFYERLQGNDIYNAATNPPFSYNPNPNSVFFSTPSQSYFTGDTAAIPLFPASMTTLAKTYKAPAVAQFSLGVQHELAPSVVWVVQYVGNLSWHQNVDRQVNNYPLTTAPTYGTTDNTLRTYAGFGPIQQQENSTNASYNGFQTGVRMQNKWGLSAEVDYTWSHEIDITSNDLAGPATPGNGTQGSVSNPWNLRYDKGSGGYDRRNILVGNYVYHLPIFNKSQGLVHSIAGGWTLAGTFVDETGEPLNVAYNGPDTIGLGGGYTNKPNVAQKISYPKTVAHWFDPATFTAPVEGFNLGFGNSRKDYAVGPGRVNFTTSAYKSFDITEKAKVELRVESFNTFNHTEWNQVDNTYTGGNIKNTWDPRVLQFGGTFSF